MIAVQLRWISQDDCGLLFNVLESNLPLVRVGGVPLYDNARAIVPKVDPQPVGLGHNAAIQCGHCSKEIINRGHARSIRTARAFRSRHSLPRR